MRGGIGRNPAPALFEVGDIVKYAEQFAGRSHPCIIGGAKPRP